MSTIVDLAQQQFKVVVVSNNILTTTEHDSLRIWSNKNRWWWYSKNIGGGIKEWLDYFNHPPEDYEIYSDELDLTIKNNDSYFDYDVFIEIGIGHLGYNDYIASRNITKETANHFKLEIKNNNIIIPINKDNKRIGSLIRLTSGPVRYQKILQEELPVFWNLPIDSNKSTFIFEGAWSVMRWWQVLGDKYNYLATLSFAATQHHFEYLSGLNNIIWCLDNDRNRYGELLPRVKQKIYKIYNQNNKHVININKVKPDDMVDIDIQNVAKTCLKRFMD